MLREKLFLSIFFLVLSFLANLAALPLFLLLITDVTLAARCGLLFFFLLPVISLGLLWRSTISINYQLRCYSFGVWGICLAVLSIANFALINSQEKMTSILFAIAIACIAISMHAAKKAQKKTASTAINQ